MEINWQKLQRPLSLRLLPFLSHDHNKQQSSQYLMNAFCVLGTDNPMKHIHIHLQVRRLRELFSPPCPPKKGGRSGI